MKWLSKFVKEDSGATAVEYGIMIATIASVIITIVIAVGSKVNAAFNNNRRRIGCIFAAADVIITIVIAVGSKTNTAFNTIDSSLDTLNGP